MFFWNSLAFSMIQRMLAIWSLVPLLFLKPAWTSGSSRFMYCWSLAWTSFEHYFTSMWHECSWAVVWAFFGIAFLWIWNENWPFPVLWPLLSWMLSFKPIFSLSSFYFIKRHFSASSLSAIRVVSSAYLRFLIFFLAVLIPACVSSSPAFLLMYSAYKLNKQGDNIQPWHPPFPIWNQSIVPCPVLTVASWPAYRFLKRQVRWSGIPISWRIFHSLLWSTQSKALA